jgi:hypothetical protein
MVGPQDTSDRTLADPLLEELARSPDLTPFAALVEPLLAYDQERRSDLVRTLRVYFAAGANARPSVSFCTATAYSTASLAWRS